MRCKISGTGIFLACGINSDNGEGRGGEEGGSFLRFLNFDVNH